MNEKQLAEAVRAVMSSRPAKDNPPPRPTKRDLKRRFKLKVVRGKPQMTEIK